MTHLLLLLLLSRPYFPVTVCGMKANHHTHVSVSGKVTLVKHEPDGDLHMRIENGGCSVVAECIPELRCKAPRVGHKVTVKGISRFDGEHHWPEIHPVETLR